MSEEPTIRDASNENLIALMYSCQSTRYDDTFHAIEVPDHYYGDCDLGEEILKEMLSRNLGNVDVLALNDVILNGDGTTWIPDPSKLIVSAHDNLTDQQRDDQDERFARLIESLDVRVFDELGHVRDGCEIIMFLEQICVWRYKQKKKEDEIDDILGIIVLWLDPDYDNAINSLEALARVVQYGTKAYQKDLLRQINDGSFFDTSAWDDWMGSEADRHRQWLEEALHSLKTALLKSVGVRLKFKRAIFKLKIVLAFQSMWIASNKKRYAFGGSGYEEARQDFVKRTSTSNDAGADPAV